MIAARKVSTLILVHRRQLMEQWGARLKTLIELPQEGIGQIGGGVRKPTNLIDVAMIQSLAHGGVVDDLVADYGQVIVDECHHLSAVSFEAVARRAKAKFVLGLSATVTRKDGHHPIIFMQCGPVRFRVDAKSEAAARPFGHRVVQRRTSFILPPGLEKERQPIQHVYAALAADGARSFRNIRQPDISVRCTFRFCDLRQTGLSDIPGPQVSCCQSEAPVVALVGITGAAPTRGRKGGADKQLKLLVGPAGLEPATRP